MSPSTAGIIPCTVYVSASAITATATAQMNGSPFNAWQDLEYTWNFGDASGTETFTRPTDGATVNANTQTGPEATYVYRTATTYTITLSIRGKNGSGYTTAQVTKQIIVAADTNTQVFVDSSASPVGADGSSAHPWVTVDQMSTAIAAGANITVNVARGSTFTGTGTFDGKGFLYLKQGCSNLRIRPWAGTVGANPIFTATSGSQPAVFLWNNDLGSGFPTDDIVISGMDFVQNGPSSNFAGVASFGSGATSTATITNITLDHCNFNLISDNFTNVVSIASVSVYSRFTFWGGSVTNSLTSSNVDIGILLGIEDYMSFYGLTVSGRGVSATLSHHIYPTVHNHSCYKWMPFGAGPNRGFCINGNYDNIVGETDNITLTNSDYFLVSECDLTGANNAVDLGNNINTPVTTQFTTVVVEKNAIHDLLSGFGFLFGCGQGVTIRDNRIFNLPADGWYSPSAIDGSVLYSKLYRNKIYYPSSVAGSLGAYLENEASTVVSAQPGGGSNPALFFETPQAIFTAFISGASITATISTNATLTVTAISSGTLAAGQIVNYDSGGDGGRVIKLTSGPFSSTGVYGLDGTPSGTYTRAMTTYTLTASSVSFGTMLGNNNGLGTVAFDINGSLNSQTKMLFGSSLSYAVTPGQIVSSEVIYETVVPLQHPVGARVKFTAGTPPSGFSLNTDYWVMARTFPGATFTLSASSSGPAIVSSGSATGLTMKTEWVNPQVFYGNYIQSDSTSAIMTNFGWSYFQSSANNSLINNNQYYAPNIANWTSSSALGWNDLSVSNKTFAAFQTAGFDGAGAKSSSGFGWTTPVTIWSNMN